MTECTTKILIKAISFSESEFSSIKKQLATLDWTVLLESADPQHCDSNWSIYSAQPIATLQTFAGKTNVWKNNQHSEHQSDPLQILHSLRTSLFSDLPSETELPFTGGALGYLGYELGYHFETILNCKQPKTHKLPEMAIGFYDWALLYNHQKSCAFLVVHALKNTNQDIKTQWDERYQWLIQQCEMDSAIIPFKLTSDWSANMNKQAYQKKFNRIQDYILGGDCYQVNLTQRFQADYQGDEYQAYQALLADNRPPFAAFLRLPKQTILSLSPERFLKSKQGLIETKPIKGTTARFNDLKKDQASREALLASEKDRAENLMIVDLMRNDLGRVCQAGSVCVPSLFAIESFPAVHHLVSTVKGRLAPQYSSEDLLRACFPGGSITGAPKIRAMSIIAELEPNDRHIYCGSIGYINGNGEMDMNIAIRTLVCHQQKIYCWAGGGIVADSDSSQEYQESFDKVSKILPCLKTLNKADPNTL